LNKHPYVNILPIDNERRKSTSYKKEMLASCDIAFLCLPDKSAIETVEIADQLGNESPVIIDASTAHRTNADWAYGLPELGQNYKNKILESKRIAVPGCYPTGANLIIKPLIDYKYISSNNPFIISAVSGYSGGGKDLIRYFKEENHEPFFTYGLNLDHKHLPEIKFHNNLSLDPIFMPSVGDFIQGMIVSIPLHFSSFIKKVDTETIQTFMEEFYLDSKFVSVLKKNEGLNSKGYLRPDNLVNTNFLDISVFGNDKNEQLVISSRLDNLGKGASGAAIQCMNLVLGYDEALGL
jgi:N-acetyl-gamma-glutamyl-phosphate reductase